MIYNMIKLFVSYNYTMSGQAVIGLMDSAYFVSKNDLLKWINQALHLELTYIEDLGSGSIYCQLIDAYYKHVVPMSKLNWRSKFEYEFMSNLKIFQQCLEKIGVSKKIDVNKLVKAKKQDNLEMIQWLKRYLEMTATKLEPYDPVARRNGEHFYSHHSQKDSFVNRPSKQSFNSTLCNISIKKDYSSQQNSHKNDKIQRIKKILGDGLDPNSKLEMISKVVNSSLKKALKDKNTNQQMEQQLQ